MTALYYFLTTLFIFICVIMTLLILIQKGRGGGLSGAFGGAGGNTAFGTKTGDVLTWATSIIFGLFILIAVFLNLVANKIGKPVSNSAVPTISTPRSGNTPPPTQAPVEAPFGG